MSDKDQKTGFDDDLVTRSYERLKEVQPPDSLDRRILAVAGEEADRKRTQDHSDRIGWTVWGYRFAAAATIFLTVSVTLRMLTGSGDGEMPAPGSIQSETTLSPAPALSSEAPSQKRADNALMMRAEEQAPQGMSAMSAPESDADVPDGREVVQTKVFRQRDESASAETESGTAEIASFLADGQAAPQDALSEPAASHEHQENLPAAMRQKPDEWLAAIDGLLDDGQTQWARREIALFRERWPDLELDEKYDID